MRLTICLLLCACAPVAVAAEECPWMYMFAPGYIGPTVPLEGGIVSIPVGEGTGSRCTWTAVSNAAWLEVLTPTGNLPGTVQLSVAPNTGPPRFTYLRFGLNSIYVGQAASCCKYPYVGCRYVAKQNSAINQLSADVSFRCAMGSQCEWTAQAFGGASVTSPASGRGNTVVYFSAGLNCTDHDVQGGIQINKSVAGYFQQPTEWYNSTTSFSAPSLTFQVQQGDANPPPPQRISVSSWSYLCSNLPYWVSAPSESWLQVDAARWSTQSELEVNVDPTGLAPGTYTGEVTLGRDTYPSLGRPLVTFIVLPRTTPIRLAAAPATIAFIARAGDPSPLPRSMNISAPGIATTLIATPPGHWLTAIVSGRTPSAQITVTPQPQGRMPGFYTGLLEVRSADLPGGIGTIPVSLTIRSSDADREEESELLVSEESVQLEVEPPYTPIERRIRLTSNRSLDVNAVVQPAGISWLRLSTFAGVTPYDLRMEILPATVAAGTYEAVVVLSAIGVSKTVRVRCTVIPPVRLLPGETSVTFTPTAPAHMLYVTATGRSVPLTATSGSPWLTVTPATGQTPVNLQLRATAGTLAPGFHSTWIALAGAGTTTRVPVFLDIPLPAPTLTPIGPASPGAWIQINGDNLASFSLSAALPLPLTLGGTTVLLVGAPIPIHSIEPTHILAQIPPATPEGRSTLAVRTPSGISNGIELLIAPASPVILAIDPGRAGQPVAIYASGLGALRSGICQHIIRAEIDGLPAEVVFAGASPGQVGLYQVNAIVPPFVAGTYAVQIFAAEVPSNRFNIRVD